jgi:hypothetical protein
MRFYKISARKRRLPSAFQIWKDMEWKQADKGKLKEFLNLPIEEFNTRLNSMSDSDAELLVFGIKSLDEPVLVDLSSISWNSYRQGSYEEVMNEVQENGPEYYDTRHPLIVDLEGTELELNDGHHRYLVATEFEHQSSLYCEIQFDQNQAKALLIQMKNEWDARKA